MALGLRRRAQTAPSGVYLDRVMTQTIDRRRVERVLEKWVRGLHWKEYGTRLPADLTFEVAQTPDAQTRTMIPMAQPSKGAWPGTFEYWHSRDDSDPTKTRWVFLVWDAMGFIAVTNQELTRSCHNNTLALAGDLWKLRKRGWHILLGDRGPRLGFHSWLENDDAAVDTTFDKMILSTRGHHHSVSKVREASGFTGPNGFEEYVAACRRIGLIGSAP